MPMDLNNNPLTSFIRTSQSVSKEGKSILRTVRGKCYFQVSHKAPYIRTTTIQYIYICDMFFETSKNIDFTGYADDNTPYTCSSNIEVLETFKGIRATLSMVLGKSLGSNCRKVSPSY